eukprot:TRINITY_DN10382_c0_g1_i1.p1 TRINITY_DN10382_c0_g1~~TRINITY_DN10382_c0_g1_i1.p1  ORF type:complete len:1143 (+),score=197.71 TRINITY_DN10382_c0_g1_i1:53-3430(+)
MAAAQVLGHIRGLHSDLAHAQAHSEFLQRFQQAPEAWAVVHELLTNSYEEVVHYFASHTLVTKLQAGHLPSQGCCRLQLMRYIALFLKGPPAVRRQLVVGLVDYALCRPSSEDEAWLMDCVQQLSSSSDALLALLELLATISDEAASRKVVANSQRRLDFATNMLRHTNTVLDALWKASQTNEICAIGSLRALHRWLALQHASPALRAQKRSGSIAGCGSGPFTADLVRQGNLHEHPLVRHAASAMSNVRSGNLEVLRACGDVLSEASRLTNETTTPASILLHIIITAVITGSRELLSMTQPTGGPSSSHGGYGPGGGNEAWLSPESELGARLAIVGRLVSELGGVFTRLVVAGGLASATLTTGDGEFLPLDDAAKQRMLAAEEMSKTLTNLADVADNFCMLRCTDIAKCGLDFWYDALAQHLGSAREEDDPFDEDANAPALQRIAAEGWTQAQARNRDQERERRLQEMPYLIPHVQNMVKAHWRAVRYPPEPEHEALFEWDDFVRFRELCSFNVTEACMVVSPKWIIDHIGVLLDEIFNRKPFAWQDVDACVFMLTGVASRAPAGEDTVIPTLIKFLPGLPYPKEGFKAMLLRSAASRLILFTSGYLAVCPEPCKHILRFLTIDHLPAIPAITATQSNDAKNYCESLACDAMKMVMTAARKSIVAPENGTMWKDVVMAVIGIVADSRFNLDSRAQLVFGIGQVLSVLNDWNELEAMLGQFVSGMQEPLAPLLAALPAEPLGSRAVKTTRDGKAPKEIKLYIAAASSVYDIPPRNDDLIKPDHHPVLAVVEQHFATLEKVCIHHTQYEDFMEQVCLAFSYILGFAREYAPSSPVFVPIMNLMARCCEQHPQPFYMGLVRSVVGFFASAGNDQLDGVLVNMTGSFIVPITRRLAAEFGNGSHNIGAGQPPLMPPLNAAAYEMLAETLRHRKLTLLAIRSCQWMNETLDGTVEVLAPLVEQNQAVHEKTVCAMLRFIRNVLLWADPEISKSEPSSDFQEVHRAAQEIIGERPLPRGVALPRLIVASVRLLAAAAPNGPGRGELVPCIADVLRALFTGPFEFTVTSQLPNALRLLPKPLAETLGDTDHQKLVQQLKMEKGDSKRFVRTIITLAEQFAVILKKAQFNGA